MTGPSGRPAPAHRLTLTVLPRPYRVALGVCSALLLVLAILSAVASAAYIARGRQIASIAGHPVGPALREKLGVSVAPVLTDAGTVACALLYAFYCLLVLLRNRAWLEGATLVRRDVFSTRRCDLATVPVRLATAGLLRVTCLIALDSATMRKARLPLRYLTAPDLAALADAITLGVRRDPQGWQVATGLRRRAATRQAAMLQLPGALGPYR
jgi:hypothetical protein